MAIVKCRPSFFGRSAACRSAGVSLERNCHKEHKKRENPPSVFLWIFVSFCGYEFFAASRNAGAGNPIFGISKTSCLRRTWPDTFDPHSTFEVGGSMFDVRIGVWTRVGSALQRQRCAGSRCAALRTSLGGTRRASAVILSGAKNLVRTGDPSLRSG